MDEKGYCYSIHEYDGTAMDDTGSKELVNLKKGFEFL